METQHVTIEQTGKGWKLGLIITTLMVLVGFLLPCGGCMLSMMAAAPGTTESGEASALIASLGTLGGVTLISLGLAGWIFCMVGKWWQHG